MDKYILVTIKLHFVFGHSILIQCKNRRGGGGGGGGRGLHDTGAEIGGDLTPTLRLLSYNNIKTLR